MGFVFERSVLLLLVVAVSLVENGLILVVIIGFGDIGVVFVLFADFEGKSLVQECFFSLFSIRHRLILSLMIMINLMLRLVIFEHIIRLIGFSLN